MESKLNLKQALDLILVPAQHQLVIVSSELNRSVLQSKQLLRSVESMQARLLYPARLLPTL